MTIFSAQVITNLLWTAFHIFSFIRLFIVGLWTHQSKNWSKHRTRKIRIYDIDSVWWWWFPPIETVSDFGNPDGLIISLSHISLLRICHESLLKYSRFPIDQATINFGDSVVTNLTLIISCLGKILPHSRSSTKGNSLVRNKWSGN